jgi:hypothetical protein
VPALHNRAKELREDAARAVRYKLPEPVITDSERTCDQANPGTGAHCHRGGDHGVHRDSDGGEWRTDAPEPEAADIAYDRTHPDPYRTWVNGEQPAGVTA